MPAQWTFVGDEKTFLSVPNLRVALNSFNANDALIIGRVTKPRYRLLPKHFRPCLQARKCLATNHLLRVHETFSVHF